MAVRTIKFFIFLTIFCTLASALFDKFLPAASSVTSLLSLSYWGLQHLFLWQPLTYLFIYPAPHGLDIGLVINLFFNMFMLYRLGLLISELRGLRHFLVLFFGCALAASLTATFFFLTHPSPTLFAGASPALFGLVLSAVILCPEMDLLLFLTFPVQAKWLVALLLSAFLLIDLSSGYFLSFATNFASVLFAYFYALFVWQQKSPYPLLHPLEDLLMELPRLFSSHHRSSPSSSKIYDFRTGKQIMNDETFMNACLEKISRHGKKSLSLYERFRLYRISKRHSEKKRPFGR